MTRPRGIKQRHPLGSVASRSGVSLLSVVSASSVTNQTGVKISQLPPASVGTTTDQLEVNQGGVSRRLTLEQIRDLISPEISVGDFGAVGDGITDDAPAIQAAIDAAATTSGTVVFAAKPYRIASTLTANSVTLTGTSFLAGAPVLGTRLVADAGLAIALKLITTDAASPNITAVTVSNLTVTRAGTSPATSTIGIQVLAGYNVIFTDVKSENHGICWSFNSIFLGGGGAGISAHLTSCYSARATDAHCVIDGWPEVYWVNGRFGDNGGGDYNCNTHVRCQGGGPGTAGGPNTVKFIGVQFNQGSSLTSVSHFWEFVNLAGPGLVDTGNFAIIGCHIEGLNGANIYSDASWTRLQRMHWFGCNFNTPSIPMFALNAATAISEWHWHANSFYCSTFNLTPTAQMDMIEIEGGRISGTTHITGVGGSSLTMTGVSHDASLTLDGNWGAANIIAPLFNSGTIINNATGNVAVIKQGSAALSGNVVAANVVQAGTGAANTGYAVLNTGGTLNAGYLAFFDHTSTRLGYIGYTEGQVNYSADAAGGHVFDGASATFHSPATFSGALTGTTATFSSYVQVDTPTGPALTMGVATDLDTFNLVSLNGNRTLNGSSGIIGGGNVNLYHLAEATGAHVFRAGGADTANIDGTGNLILAGIPFVKSATAIAAGSAVQAFIRGSSLANFGLFYGSGAPTFAAAANSLYIRSDGNSTTTRMYVNTTGSTTWATVTTSA